MSGIQFPLFNYIDSFPHTLGNTILTNLSLDHSSAVGLERHLGGSNAREGPRTQAWNPFWDKHTCHVCKSSPESHESMSIVLTVSCKRDSHTDLYMSSIISYCSYVYMYGKWILCLFFKYIWPQPQSSK